MATKIEISKKEYISSVLYTSNEIFAFQQIKALALKSFCKMVHTTYNTETVENSSPKRVI